MATRSQTFEIADRCNLTSRAVVTRWMVRRKNSSRDEESRETRAAAAAVGRPSETRQTFKPFGRGSAISAFRIQGQTVSQRHSRKGKPDKQMSPSILAGWIDGGMLYD